MPEYVTLDALRETAERDVEVNGRRYRVRRLSPIELMELIGSLPVTADADAPARAGRAAAADPRRTLVLPLCRALVVPKITEEELYLLPAEDIPELVKAVQEVSGLARPFGGSDTEPIS